MDYCFIHLNIEASLAQAKADVTTKDSGNADHLMFVDTSGHKGSVLEQRLNPYGNPEHNGPVKQVLNEREQQDREFRQALQPGDFFQDPKKMNTQKVLKNSFYSSQDDENKYGFFPRPPDRKQHRPCNEAVEEEVADPQLAKPAWIDVLVIHVPEIPEGQQAQTTPEYPRGGDQGQIGR